MASLTRLSTAASTTRSVVVPAFHTPLTPASALVAPLVTRNVNFGLPQRTRRRVCRAASGEADVKDVIVEAQNDDADWVPVCLPEELPKGVRKEVEVDGAQILLFWYRNQIYAIESRSPAEGAYSEGFIKAKFTQDFCIECPSTGSLFSLKDGSIVSWYPNNPVLAAITPASTCRPLEMYQVKLAQDAIYVDVNNAVFSKTVASRGGAGTSIDNNNVFTVQPTVYFEGMDPSNEQATLYMDNVKPAEGLNPAVAIATTAGVGAVAVAGTAVCIYLENLVLLGVFWAVLGGAAAFVAYQYINKSGANLKQQ